ncbi:MAG: esterase, partial [Burkholderiales bacterium]|nr:esterase [Opitutaceae bacterium]
PAATAPAARPAPVRSPEIHADGTVTFRLRAPTATLVKMWGDWDGEGNDMTKDADGVWSVTLGSIPPNIYAYSFNIDGLTIADPANGALKPMRSPTSSVLIVPGEPPVPINRVAGVPHGVVHLHDYDSQSLGAARRLRVYTPPGYDAAKRTRYPVLYLLHGSGDNESTWTEFGKAHLILDNLIAAKKAVPMIVVMTDGHARNSTAPEARAQNTSAFAADFLTDVMPLVESSYRIRADRDHRAIVGLSMGGNQSLLIGLNHRDLFAWVGGMSSAIRDPDQPLASFWADPVSKKTPLRLLWLRIGRDDYLLKENRAFDALLTAKNIPHDYAESAGGHIWPVWRSYLADLAPLLFQTPRSAR